MIHLPKTLFTYLLGALLGATFAMAIVGEATGGEDWDGVVVIPSIFLFIGFIVSWLWGEDG